MAKFVKKLEKKSKEEVKEVISIITNKNGGVVEIVRHPMDVSPKGMTTPEDLKDVLNMFRGQPYPYCAARLQEYMEADEEERARINYSINN